MSSDAASKGNVAIAIRGLSKAYRIAHNTERHRTLADALMHRVRNPMQRTQYEEFWSLKDISFDVKRGDVVGVIGRNGAGKSTLLKILSRITKPTKGEVRLYGRVGSLLEVGTGFHPELTGRENIFLNGAILGMTRSEVIRQFDAIVEFSGTEKFLDTPVKRYSSGMYVRLAFAVAAHLNPEILIVDEVLAVGDSEFQKKCLGKMGEVAQEGRTVLFVSHNLSTVRTLCRTGVLLQRGQLLNIGPADDMVDEYINLVEQNAANGTLLDASDESGYVKGFRFYNPETGVPVVCTGDPAVLAIELRQAPKSVLGYGFTVYSREGTPICHFNTQVPSSVDNLEHPESCVVCSFPEFLLAPGSYYVNVAIFEAGRIAQHIDRAFSFRLYEGRDSTGRATRQLAGGGFVTMPHRWQYISAQDLPAASDGMLSDTDEVAAGNVAAEGAVR